MRFREFQSLAAPDRPLTEGQGAFVDVAFDGGWPTDSAASRTVWGPSLLQGVEIPDICRRYVIVVMGARSGKTWLAALRLVHLGATVDLSPLARGEEAVCPIVAPDVKTARITLNYIRGFVYDLLGEAVIQDTADRITIKRDGGRKVVFQIFAASAGGKSVRGRFMPAAFLDESSMFFGVDHKVNDVEIFNAISPRLLPGGQLMVMSTPWAESGLIYDYYRDNYDHPKYCLAAWAPTLTMRVGHAEIEEIVALEREKDPVNCQREFDAEFLPSTANRFFDNRAIERAISAEPIRRDASLPCFFGGDFAFTRDASALVGVQMRGEVLEVFLTHELMPAKGKPLDPDDVVDQFGSLIADSGGGSLTADHWYERFVQKRLQENHLMLRHAPGGSEGVARMHVTARSLLHQGRVRIPPDRNLIRQLKDITATANSGGTLTIKSPRYQTGGHGDLARAFVTALWSTSQGYGTEFGGGSGTGKRRSQGVL